MADGSPQQVFSAKHKCKGTANAGESYGNQAWTETNREINGEVLCRLSVLLTRQARTAMPSGAQRAFANCGK
jgi:hypothetical protein